MPEITNTRKVPCRGKCISSQVVCPCLAIDKEHEPYCTLYHRKLVKLRVATQA